MAIVSDNPDPRQVNSSITPLYGEFYPAAYSEQEAAYFQQFDGETHFEDFVNLNSDSDVVQFINQELQDYSDYCVRYIDGCFHVCIYHWTSDTLTPLFPCFNRASAYANAIALMSRSEEYRAEADEPLPFEIEYEKQRMADWNAKVHATLSVVDTEAHDANGRGAV